MEIDARSMEILGEYTKESDENLEKIVESLNSLKGCRIEGYIEVFNAPGYLRFFPDVDLTNTLLNQHGLKLDLTHRIVTLRFT